MTTYAFCTVCVSFDGDEAGSVVSASVTVYCDCLL